MANTPDKPTFVQPLFIDGDSIATADLLPCEPISEEMWPAIRRFAGGAYQSELAYVLQPNVVHENHPILEENGEWKLYKAIPLYSKTNASFGSFALIPNDRSIKQVKVIFQGTEIELSSTGVSSINTNLEREAAAAVFWREEGNDILEQFKVLLNDEGWQDGPFKVEVTGHSQGAAHTQYFTTLLMQDIAKNEITHINAIHNYAFNNTGPNESTLARFKTAFAQVLELHGKDFKFTASIGHSEGDPVQQTGPGTIWDDLTPEQAFIEMVKVDKGLLKAWSKDIHFENGLQLHEFMKIIYNGITGSLKAHKNDGYFAPTEAYGELNIKYPYTYYSNVTPEGEVFIRSELTNKFKFGRTLMKPVRDALHDLLDLFTKKPLHNITDTEDTEKSNTLVFSEVFSTEIQEVTPMPSVEFGNNPDYSDWISNAPDYF